MSDKVDVPYYSYAFNNIYNYTLLGGVAATAVLTQRWWMAVVGAGLEVLWMVFAPDSRLLRRHWFDKTHANRLRERAEEERSRVLAGLPEGAAQRVVDLEAKREHLLRLLSENQNLPGDLLKEELAKVDQLTFSFVDLAAQAIRFEDYLSAVDARALEVEMKAHEAVAERAKEQEKRELAAKNLAVLQMRKEKLAEIRLFVAKAHGQMDLIENTFALLADQIVTMRSPQELGGQLDELVDGVESVRSTARETEGMIDSELASRHAAGRLQALRS